MTRRAALLVAESGGHLEQLTRLEPRLRPAFDDVVYATSASDQSRSLLAGREVFFGRAVPSRGGRSALVAARQADRLMRTHHFTDVISTGSAVAVPYLMMARRHGLNAHYVESAARSTGPSLSGQILRRVPGVNLYSQYQGWARGPWQYAGSVFDGFGITPAPAPRTTAHRVVVTLGTLSRYPFPRAVEAIRRVLAEVGAADCEVFWQIGDLPGDGLPGEVHATVPAAELKAAIRAADLVFAHAGTGSSLQMLDAGLAPVLLPRTRAHNEHIDDHQQMIADALHSRALAVSASPAELTAEHAVTAMQRTVVKDTQSSPFPLAERSRATHRVPAVRRSPSSARVGEAATRRAS